MQEGNLAITLTTLDNKVHNLNISSTMTGIKLKQFIYAKLCQKLTPDLISLEYMGSIINNHKKISELMVVTGNKLNLLQKKAKLNQIEGVIADMNYTCPVSCEVGAVKMQCGHNAGSSFMTGHLRSIVDQHLYEVRCPMEDENGIICNAPWSFQKCRQVGIFTQDELDLFSEGLSKNWIKQNCKQCPKCTQRVIKIGIKHNRVKCDSCKSVDFCFMCRKDWVNYGNKFCGNQQCRVWSAMVANAPQTRQFDLKNQNVPIKVKTPQYRACPNCLNFFENKVGCKHTTCLNCKKQFCWVCLGLRTATGWSCGSYNNYCGKVAQRQILG